MYILTFWCKLVCYHHGRIIQKDLREITSLDDAVQLQSSDYGYDLFAGKNRYFGHDLETNVMSRAVASGIFLLENHKENQVVSIRSNTGYMRALNDGTVDFVAQSCSDWETMRLLTKREVEALLLFVKNGLLVNKDKQVSTFNLRKSNHKSVVFGEYEISLQALSHNNLNDNYFSRFIFYDGWKPNIATVYNPAIFYVVCGAGDIVTQFKLSLESLQKLGNYNGKLIILTNNEKDYIEKITAHYGFYDVSIYQAEAFDALDYVGSRISLLSSGALDQYQPLLYADADIIFDADVNEFLIDTAHQDKITAQEEGFTRFKTSESVGSTLYEQDIYELPEVNGFNAGLFCIPSVSRFKWVFCAAYACMKHYVTEYGRHSIPFYDQSVLNYVFYKFDVYSANPITEKVRLWSEEMDYNGTGFIHFWPAPQKSEKMRIHLENALLQ